MRTRTVAFLLGDVALIALLAGCSAAASPAATPRPSSTPAPTATPMPSAAVVESFDVAVIGDSLAKGEGVKAGEDPWPTIVAYGLRGAKPHDMNSVSVFAQGGTKIDGAEDQFRSLPVGLYDVVFILTGRNDSPVDRAEWKRRLAALADHVEASGAKVILATGPPVFVNGTFITPSDPVAEAIRGLAKGRVLVDYDAAMRALGAKRASAFYADTVHLNEAGQKWMADLALKTLVPMLPN